MSIAVSIQDVCKRNPDRGVDIILSVAVCATYFVQDFTSLSVSSLTNLFKCQACIESHDSLVQSLGLQSLAHLCEADVIGNQIFYTFIASKISKIWLQFYATQTARQNKQN